MSVFDWIVSIVAFLAAMQMKDALRFSAFADEQRERRPRPHTFG